MLVTWDLADVVDTVELLVSEVVTNAVGHAGTGGEMVLMHHEGLLRVEVSDSGGGDVAPRHARPEDVTGRGMAIVDALAARWGVVDDGRGTGDRAKRVWFEIEHPALGDRPVVVAHGDSL